jgi:chromosome segregation ATPase
MSTKELKKQFFAARKELEDLEAELPNYERLLADNAKAETERRRIKAPLDELAQAKTRVQAARELLEQHHADIEAARQEAARLEADYQRALTLDKMADHAREAAKQKEVFDATMRAANQALTPLVEKLYAAWRGLTQAQSGFRNSGRSLNNGLGVASWPYTMTAEQVTSEETKMRALLTEVQARGADTNVALTPYDGRHVSVAGLNPQDLDLPDPYGGLLWKALRLREEAIFMEHRQAQEAQEAQ